jgi:hypothetical protein
MKSTKDAIIRSFAKHGNKPSFYKEISNFHPEFLKRLDERQFRNVFAQTENTLTEMGLNKYATYFRQQIQKQPELKKIIDEKANAVFRRDYNNWVKHVHDPKTRKKISARDAQYRDKYTSVLDDIRNKMMKGDPIFSTTTMPYWKKVKAMMTTNSSPPVYSKNNYLAFLHDDASVFHEFNHHADISLNNVFGNNFSRKIKSRTPLLDQNKTPFDKEYYDYLTNNRYGSTEFKSQHTTLKNELIKNKYIKNFNSEDVTEDMLLKFKLNEGRDDNILNIIDPKDYNYVKDNLNELSIFGTLPAIWGLRSLNSK